jgi:hypothetical protein
MAASTDLTIQKSAGTSFVKSLNLPTDPKNPHNKTSASIASVTF